MTKYLYLKLLLIVVLFSTILNAKIYEDAEDGNTNGWYIYDTSPSGATISNIIENGNHIIKLQGSGKSNGYILGRFYQNDTGSWNNKTERNIKWSMKYSEEFEIFISMKTVNGHRFIVYSNKEEDQGTDGHYIRYGLGNSAKDDTWKTFTRNLTNDLQKYESDNSILSINGFLVRGSGLVILRIKYICHQIIN